MKGYEELYGINLAKWVYGTIKRQKRESLSWNEAWGKTYKKFGGEATTGTKGCPRKAAETLYLLGRIKNGGKPFKDCYIPELWEISRNGTYAILATQLLHVNPNLSKDENKDKLWSKIQWAVRREVAGDFDLPCKDAGGAEVASKLWRLGLIVDME